MDFIEYVPNNMISENGGLLLNNIEYIGHTIPRSNGIYINNIIVKVDKLPIGISGPIHNCGEEIIFTKFENNYIIVSRDGYKIKINYYVE